MATDSKLTVDRTYDVRTATNPQVLQALNVEQGKRQAQTGERVRKADIAADWLEEKAASILAERG